MGCEVMGSTPNSVVMGENFYISFNDQDTDLYGCETTALVFGQMEKFYILKGDWRAQYSKILDQGFDACLAFFKENIGDIHNFSDIPPT